ncbi:hypothetical protein V8C42DRAFT_324765 [Trichoderma barbatum]
MCFVTRFLVVSFCLFTSSSSSSLVRPGTCKTSFSRPWPRPPVSARGSLCRAACLLRVLARQLGQSVCHAPPTRSGWETALFSSCPPSRSSRDDVASGGTLYPSVSTSMKHSCEVPPGSAQ